MGTHVCDYHKKIHVYEVLMDFNVPLGIEGDFVVVLTVGQKIVTIGERVFVPDEHAEEGHYGMPDDNMTQAVFKRDFVEINPKIFKKI